MTIQDPQQHPQDQDAVTVSLLRAEEDLDWGTADTINPGAAQPTDEMSAP